MATKRLSCPPAPGPLEDYARHFDADFASLAQRRAFRAYRHGLLLPRARNKTRTGLAGTEPVWGAQLAPAQRLQWFLSEANWEAAASSARRLERLLGDPATRPTDQGVLILEETGDRKDGTKTAHVAPQYLGSVAAASPTASSRSPACGPTKASITRCTSRPTPRPVACPEASSTPPSAPNRNWPST